MQHLHPKAMLMADLFLITLFLLFYFHYFNTFNFAAYFYSFFLPEFRGQKTLSVAGKNTELYNHKCKWIGFPGFQGLPRRTAARSRAQLRGEVHCLRATAQPGGLWLFHIPKASGSAQEFPFLTTQLAACTELEPGFINSFVRFHFTRGFQNK